MTSSSSVLLCFKDAPRRFCCLLILCKSSFQSVRMRIYYIWWLLKLFLLFLSMHPPTLTDRLGSGGLPGFCVSVRRKMRRKKRDKGGSRKEGAEERWRGEKEPVGSVQEEGGTPGILVLLSALVVFFLFILFFSFFSVKLWVQPVYCSQVCFQTLLSGYRVETQHRTHPSLSDSHTHPLSIPRWITVPPLLYSKSYLRRRSQTEDY